MRLSEPDIADRASFQCDGCLVTFFDSDSNIHDRTFDGRTYCKECWKLGEFESDDEDTSLKNQIY